MTRYDVIVVGTVCCDFIFHGLPSFPKLGEEIWTKGVEVTAGGAMNSPAALSRLGLNVGLTTPIGNDLWGDIILSKMKEEGIFTELLYKVNGPFPQISVSLNYNQDRAFVSYGEKLEREKYLLHIKEIIKNHESKLYHFYSSPEEGQTDLIIAAKSKRSLISLDTGWDPEWLKSTKVREQIALADLFMPNLKEAQLITGKENKYEALKELAQLTPTVVIKLGAEGAIGYYSGKIYEHGPEPGHFIDATGAGDCFVAGFIYSWLKKRDVDESMKIANFCGASCVGTIGGYAGAPTMKDINAFLKDIKPSDLSNNQKQSSI
jgi:sugar/nucleoside kinase (ribokinase family)